MKSKSSWWKSKGVGVLVGVLMLGGFGLENASAGQASVRGKAARAKHRRRASHQMLSGIPEKKVKHKPALDTETMRRRFVRANPDELYEPRRRNERFRRPRRKVSLDLFDGTNVAATLLRVEGRGRNSFTWFGYVPGEEIGDVILTVVDGVMMGTVHVGVDTYHLRALKPNLFEVLQIDLDAFGPPHGAIEDPPRDDLNDLDAVDIKPPRVNSRRFTARARRNFLAPKNPYVLEEIGPDGLELITDSGSRIDILVAYTPEAAEAAKVLVDFAGNPIPTATNIQTAIQHMVDKTNYTIGLSGIPTGLHLVHTAPVKGPEPNVDSDTMLDFMEHGDGKFDELLGLGDQYRADITSLIVAGQSNFEPVCGVTKALPDLVAPEDQSYTDIGGRGQRSAFGKNVVAVRCGVLNMTFAHEFGHNTGLKHDFYVEPDTPAVPHGRGFVLVPPRRRTVMAYDHLCHDYFPDERPAEPLLSVCEPLPRFSTPLATFDNWPLGAAGSAFVKPVNAVDAMTQALWTVANFRHSLLTP